jgi:hypothetical protein
MRFYSKNAIFSDYALKTILNLYTELINEKWLKIAFLAIIAFFIQPDGGVNPIYPGAYQKSVARGATSGRGLPHEKIRPLWRFP